jgi:hypothetical protein
VSRFTEAMISALNGAASSDHSGQWSVETQYLGAAISHILKLGNRRRGVPPQNAKSGGNDAGFLLHQYPNSCTPHVPVVISCKPNIANQFGYLNIERAGSIVHQRDPDAEGWNVNLEVDQYYSMHLKFLRNYSGGFKGVFVRPPYRDIEIGVT